MKWTTEAIDAFVIKEVGNRYITWKAHVLYKGKSVQILARELPSDMLEVTGKVFTLLEADASNWEAGGVEG